MKSKKLLPSDLITVNYLASILGIKGIEALVKNNTESGRLAGFDILHNEVNLFANSKDFEQAKAVIEVYNKGNLSD